MVLKECILTNNSCYIKGKKIVGNPTGIVVHSTGANNKTLKRYVQPIKGQDNYNAIIADIGLNKYSNSWNRPDIQKCVHAFIGENANGDVEVYKTLPYDICCWGVGSGKNGSYNYNPNAHIQFEICEDSLASETYFNRVMKEATEYCAYLCKMFNLNIKTIVSHYECYKLGYGSNHGDIDYWLKKYNKNMNWFRKEVDKLLAQPPEKEKATYRVQVGTYSNKDNAEKVANELINLGYNAKIVEVIL